MASIHKTRLGDRTSKTRIVSHIPSHEVSNGHSRAGENGPCTYSITMREVGADDVTSMYVVTLKEAEAAAFVAFYTRMQAEQGKV